jgi:CHAT domain-containing protein/tetratricopeptide (TPR) repeat protein
MIALALLLPLAFPAVSSAQKNGFLDGNREGGQTQERSLSELLKAPPPTLQSGRAVSLTFSETDPDGLDGGFLKTFRYGTVSRGPVEIEVSGGSGVIELRVLSGKDKLLKTADLKKTGAGTLRLSHNAEEGAEIRISVKIASLDEGAKLSLILVEKNRAEGEQDVNIAVKVVSNLLSRAKAAMNEGKPALGISLLRKGFLVIDATPGLMKSEKLLQVGNALMSAANSANDLDSVSRSLRLVVAAMANRDPPWSRQLVYYRNQLAIALKNAGLLEDALAIQEELLRVCEATFSPDSTQVLTARNGLASTLYDFGRFQRAKQLFEECLPLCIRKYGPEHILTLGIRFNIANTLAGLGDFRKALSIREETLAICEELFHTKNPMLQKFRLGLVRDLNRAGDFSGARILLEKVIEALSGPSKKNPTDLLSVRKTLASLLENMGDYHAAKEIREQIVSVSEQTMNENSVMLLQARIALGTTLEKMKRFDEALKIQKAAVNRFSGVLPSDSVPRLIARGALAVTLTKSGDAKAGYNLLVDVIRDLEKNYSPENNILIVARANLIEALEKLNRFDEAEALCRKTLTELKDFLPAGHLGLNALKGHLSVLMAFGGRWKEAARLMGEMMEARKRLIARKRLTGAVRENEAFIAAAGSVLYHYFSFGREGLFSARDSFVALEAHRSIGTESGRIRRKISRIENEKTKGLQRELAIRTWKLASAKKDSFIKAVRARDIAERALFEGLRQLEGIGKFSEVKSFEEMKDAIPADWIAVAFALYPYFHIPENCTRFEDAQKDPSLLAFVVTPEGSVDRVELGAAEEIIRAVDLWKKTLCSERGEQGRKRRLEAGRRLRQQIWQPLEKHLDGKRKVILLPDASLSTVPLEALPLGDGVLADRYTFAYADSLASATAADEGERREERGFLAFGDIDYDSEPALFSGQEQAALEEPGREIPSVPPGVLSEIPRSPPEGSGTTKVTPLPGTLFETEDLSSLYREVFSKNSLLVKGKYASKASLQQLAHSARYLHIATHGYFAPEKYISPLDSGMMGTATPGSTMDEKVRGLAPSLLCGLKLAGCNLPQTGLCDEGIITGEEIRGLDLSQCELAVLSACESNVGILRTGQGIMSLQKALAIAGAGGSITSLWKVYDEPTRLFFTKFYSLLWKEGKHPAVALRESKLWLRGLKGAAIESWRKNPSGPLPRGEIVDGPPPETAGGDAPFAAPFFWASFVYWGSVK